MKFCIISPCHNEGDIIERFLQRLESTVSSLDGEFHVVIVNDGSTDNTNAILHNFQFSNQNIALSVIETKKNVGHQSAIYQGMVFAAELACDKFIIMDSDGEDDPKAIKELVEVSDKDIVHVVRGKRSEGFIFKLFYFFYKLVFYVVTGKKMNFGNYCMVNKRILTIMVDSSFIHLAANLSKIKASKSEIIFDRGKRIFGQSKMNITSLVQHGFKSLIEYSEDLLMIFLKVFVLILVMIGVFIIFVTYHKFVTKEAIPGWSSSLILSLVNMALINFGFFALGMMQLNLMQNLSKGKNIVYYNVIKSEKDGRG